MHALKGVRFNPVDDDLHKAGDDCDTDSEESGADKFGVLRVN